MDRDVLQEKICDDANGIDTGHDGLEHKQC